LPTIPRQRAIPSVFFSPAAVFFLLAADHPKATADLPKATADQGDIPGTRTDHSKARCHPQHLLLANSPVLQVQHPLVTVFFSCSLTSTHCISITHHFNSCKASQHRCSLLAGLTGGFGRNSPVAFVDG
jgi:hypothetical protein